MRAQVDAQHEPTPDTGRRRATALYWFKTSPLSAAHQGRPNPAGQGRLPGSNLRKRHLGGASSVGITAGL